MAYNPNYGMNLLGETAARISCDARNLHFAQVLMLNGTAKSPSAGEAYPLSSIGISFSGAQSNTPRIVGSFSPIFVRPSRIVLGPFFTSDTGRPTNASAREDLPLSPMPGSWKRSGPSS